MNYRLNNYISMCIYILYVHACLLELLNWLEYILEFLCQSYLSLSIVAVLDYPCYMMPGGICVDWPLKYGINSNS